MNARASAAAIQRPPEQTLTNALTIDVEDYFQVWALSPRIERSQWESIPCRVERNVDRLLELLDHYASHATFFTLGWVAERYPQMIRRIVAGGHELGSHGYDHRRANEQSRAEFTLDVVRAKRVLEDVGGMPVNGYRAPSFSIGLSNLWAFDCLIEAGYRYSSSVYPVHHDHYGMPGSPRFPYRVRPELVEIPVTTTRIAGKNVPAGGGGYFRLAPYTLSRWAIRRVNRIDAHSAIFYLHPWEIDPGQPRVSGLSLKSRFRHYLNLDQMELRLRRLLADFRWDRVDQVFDLDSI